MERPEWLPLVDGALGAPGHLAGQVVGDGDEGVRPFVALMDSL